MSLKRIIPALILCLCLSAQVSYATVAASAVMEVRPTTGSDTNGGCRIAGSTGTDLTYPTPTVIAFTDLVIDAVSTTKLTSAANPFSATSVGNCLRITGGTGFTAGLYSVTSVAGAVATMNSAVGVLLSTGGTGNMGGALASLTQAATDLASATTSYFVFAKAESGITQAATATFPSVGSVSNVVPYGRIEGYTSTRGDGGRANITMSTNTGLTAIAAGIGWTVSNFNIDCASLGTCTGLTISNFSKAQNIKISNCVNGLSNSGSTGMNVMVGIEVTGCSGLPVSLTQPGFYFGGGSYIHDNTLTGITVSGSGSGTVEYVISARNGTLATHYGLVVTTGLAMNINHCIFDSNGGDGVRLTNGGSQAGLIAKNSIMWGNGVVSGTGYGLASTNVAYAAAWFYDGNAYGGNQTAPRFHLDDTTVNKLDGVAPYTNVLDKTLTVNPWVNSAGGNYTLNSTAGGGAVINNAGYPGVFGAGTVSTTGYPAMGAVQPQGGGQVGYVGQ